MKTACSTFTTAVFLGMLLPTIAMSAEPKAAAPADPTSLYESVEVTIANIEVFVTDRSGKPVTGLTRDDFELLVDGKPVPISHFFAQGPGASPAVPAAEEEGAAAPAVLAGEAPQRTMAVFLDERHLEGPWRQRVSSQLPGLIAGLGSGDHFVLIRSSQSLGLTMKSFRPSEREAISAALDGKVGQEGAEHSAESERLSRNAQQSAATQDPVLMQTDADEAIVRAQARWAEMMKTLEILERCIDALAGLPGHKSLLYVTSDLPLRPAEEFFGMTPEGMFMFDTSPRLQRVVAQANAGRVTLYGLGVPKAAEQNRHRSSRPYDLAKLNGLVDLASGTGGQFALDPSNPGTLTAKLLNDLTSFYSLGYAPTGKAADTRKIKVRVKKEGLEVRHRLSYRSRGAGESTMSRMMAALAIGESSNPLGIEVQLGEAVPDKNGNLALEVTIRFPLDQLVLVPTETFRKGQARLFLGSRAEDGTTSDITQIALPIRIPEVELASTLEKQGGYRTRILLRPQPARIVVGFRDVLGNSDSTLIVPWSPPAGEGK